MLPDLTKVSYAVLRFSLVYNFVLFAVWLYISKREGGRVSGVYLMFMALFLVRLYGISLASLARELLTLSDYTRFEEFTGGYLWHSRVIPEAIIFLILGFIKTKDFVKSYLFNDPEYRAIRGTRKTDQ